jgi:RND family efflux transporter MFP subunit
MALADELDFRHEGVIDFADNRLDRATGTLRIRASFANPDGFFTPGLFARLRLPGSEPYRAVLVAGAAIAADQSQRFVMVVGADDVVQPRAVTVGTEFGGLRVVEGVRPDERVVVNGLMRARPGMKVQPQVAPMPSRAPRPNGSTQPATRPSNGSGPATRPATSPVASGRSGVVR